MTRNRLSLAAAVALLALLVGSASFLAYQTVTRPTTITAYFSTATAIYPGDEVRISGVKVGTIEAITPKGADAEVRLKVRHGVPIFASAHAVIVAQNLVSARYIQLTPAYQRGDGPTMRDGSVIPRERTAVPLEWDEVKTQLMRLATELGPKSGVSDTSLARFIDSAATALDGNGAKLRETLSQLSGAARIFAEGSGNVADVIQQLQRFVTALRDSKDQIVLFQNRAASLSTMLNDSRSDLDAALTDLPVAIDDIRRFLATTRDPAAEQVQSLANVTQVLVDNRSELENILHITPTAIANYHNIYYPNSGGVSGAVSLANFSNPVWFICGMIGAVTNTTAPETAKLCSQYLGPALQALNFNNTPIPINAYLRPSVNPEKIIYTDPKLAPGGAGPGDPPEPPPTVSAYTGAGDVAPPPGWQPGGASGRGNSEAAIAPSPALFPGAPIPGPSAVLPGPPPTMEEMLLPQTVAPEAPQDPLPSAPASFPAEVPPTP